MNTSTAQIASAAATVKGQDERAAKTGGAPLTAASLRLGGSYGELTAPHLQMRPKSRFQLLAAKNFAQICPVSDFQSGARLLLYTQLGRKWTNFTVSL